MKYRQQRGSKSSTKLLTVGFKILLFTALLASSLQPIYCLTAVAKDQGEGQWRFQLQGSTAPAGKYRLVVYDLLTQKKLTKLKGFQETGMKDVLVLDWDCKLDEGIYYMQIFEGKTLVFGQSPEPLTWDEQNYETSNAELDRRYSLLRWKPSRASLSRINVALPSGLRLGEAASWRFHSNAVQEVSWDFLGEDGLHYREHPQLTPYLQSIPLPSYWFVVGQPLWESYKADDLFSALELPDTTLRFTLSEIEGDPSMIRVKLDPETEDYLAGRRYEVLLYLDGEFIHEESQGVNPYTYVLPENPNWQGKFPLTVNLLDYLGNWGTRSLLVKMP